MKTATQPTVLLIHPGQYHYFEEASRGVRQYAREHGHWNLVVARATQLGYVWSRKVRQADISGVVGIVTPQEKRMLASLRAPMVNTSSRVVDPSIPAVVPDNRAVGRMAAEHLLSKGFRRFGCVTQQAHHYAQLRRDGFLARLTAEDVPCRLLDTPLSPRVAGTKRAVLAWLRKLPRPAGIFASHDDFAVLVIETALRLGLRVPEDMAVVGVDNNPVTCDLATVTLSSVDTNGRRVGYEAAALLDRLMRGEPVPAAPILVPPLCVEERESTRTVSAGHPAVQAAVDHMQTHLAAVDVPTLVSRAGISRRHLEQLFRRCLHESPYDFLRRLRLERARTLLVTSDLAIKTIGGRSGFPDQRNFARQFRLHFGVSPTEYRAAGGASGRRGSVPS